MPFQFLVQERSQNITRLDKVVNLNVRAIW